VHEGRFKHFFEMKIHEAPLSGMISLSARSPGVVLMAPLREYAHRRRGGCVAARGARAMARRQRHDLLTPISEKYVVTNMWIKSRELPAWRAAARTYQRMNG
jgi:hypothetical protein